MYGTGKYTTPTTITEGEFEDNKLNGEATIISLKDGSRLKGIFKNGLKNGFFNLEKQYRGHTLSYQGEFKNDKENPYNSSVGPRV